MNYTGSPSYPARFTSHNVLLTPIIVKRVIRHSTNIRKAIGIITGDGLYDPVVTVPVESCVLYAITFLLFIGPLAIETLTEAIFAQLISTVQVCVIFHPAIWGRDYLTEANEQVILSVYKRPYGFEKVQFDSFQESTRVHGS